MTRDRVRHGFLSVVCCLLFATGSVMADPRELYKQGLEALDSARWVDAERFFRAAIAERSEERYNPLFGRRYFPHFQLGVALAEQGDCRAALDAWQASKSQGKIDKDNQLSADLDRRKQGCRDRLARLERVSGEVEELLAQTDDGFTTLAGLAAKPALANRWRARGGLGERQQILRQTVDQTRQQATAARQRQDLERLETVRDQAASIWDDLQSLVAEARSELGEVNAATSSALGRLEAETSRARSLLRSVSRLAPYPPELTRRVGAVQQLVGEAERLGEQARPQQLNDLESRLEAANRALRRASEAPPDALIVALEAHLAGDPRGVLASLDAGEPFDGPRARAHACLLRAAALHLRHVSESVQPMVEADPTESESAAPEGVAEDMIAEAGVDTGTEVGTETGSEGVPAEELPVDELAAPEGESDTEPEPPVTEDDVLQTLRTCFTLEPVVEPSRRFFSPRFVELYRRLRAEAVPADNPAVPVGE